MMKKDKNAPLHFLPGSMPHLYPLGCRSMPLSECTTHPRTTRRDQDYWPGYLVGISSTRATSSVRPAPQLVLQSTGPTAAAVRDRRVYLCKIPDWAMSVAVRTGKLVLDLSVPVPKDIPNVLTIPAEAAAFQDMPASKSDVCKPTQRH